MYMGRSILYRRDLGDAGFRLSWEKALELAEKKSLVRHVPRVLYHRAAGAVLEKRSPSYTAPAGARLGLIICSRQLQQVRECLEAVRSTSTPPVEIVVVQHVESGTGDEMRKFVEQFGGTCIDYRGSFDFARMNNLAAGRATAPYLLFLNDDVIVRQAGWDRA